MSYIQYTTHENFCAFIDSKRDEIGKLIAKECNTDAFISSVKDYMMASGASFASKKSCKNLLFKEIKKAAMHGLYIDGNQSAIQPRPRNIGTIDNPNYLPDSLYTPMIDGVIIMMTRSGKFKKIKADVVFEGDLFEHNEDNGETVLKHIRKYSSEKIRLAYCYGKLANGELIADVMTLKYIMDNIYNKKSPLWRNNIERMMIKSVTHRLANKSGEVPEISRILNEQSDVSFSFTDNENDQERQIEKPEASVKHIDDEAFALLAEARAKNYVEKANGRSVDDYWVMWKASMLSKKGITLTDKQKEEFVKRVNKIIEENKDEQV